MLIYILIFNKINPIIIFIFKFKYIIYLLNKNIYITKKLKFSKNIFFLRKYILCVILINFKYIMHYIDIIDDCDKK